MNTDKQLFRLLQQNQTDFQGKYWLDQDLTGVKVAFADFSYRVLDSSKVGLPTPTLIQCSQVISVQEKTSYIVNTSVKLKH